METTEGRPCDIALALVGIFRSKQAKRVSPVGCRPHLLIGGRSFERGF